MQSAYDLLGKKEKMYGKMRNKTVEKPDKVKNNKRGFTLVEFTIVLGILVIVMGITVSFSVLMKGVAADNREEIEFLEQNVELKEAICAWVAENDVKGSTFITKGDALTVTFDGSDREKTIRISDDGMLVCSDTELQEDLILRVNLDEIDQMLFFVEGDKRLLRCVTSHDSDEEGEAAVVTNSFLISLRLGSMVGEDNI